MLQELQSLDRSMVIAERRNQIINQVLLAAAISSVHLLAFIKTKSVRICRSADVTVICVLYVPAVKA